MMNFLEPSRFGVMTSEAVARAVLRAATAGRPRTRYSVGFYAHFGFIGRLLTSDRVVDAFMSRSIRHR
jgi:hypothetical protein